MSHFDKEKIVLPPPPTKIKLKRVHTISGSSSVLNYNNDVADCLIVGESQINKASTSSLPNERQIHQFNNIANKLDLMMDDDCSLELWAITPEQQRYYTKQFLMLQKNIGDTVQGNRAKIFFEKSGLKIKDLSHIWKLSDVDEDGALSLAEFSIAMHLVVLKRNNVDLPNTLPTPLKNAYKSLQTIIMDSSGQTSKSNDICHRSSFPKANNNNTLSANNNNNTDKNPNNVPSRRLSQNWTRFNDSPYLLNKANDCSPTNSSPTKLTNFDFNVDYIASNPNIKHPVPLRISPTSPALSSEQFVLLEDGNKSSLNSFTSINSNDSSLTNEQISPFEKNSPNNELLIENKIQLTDSTLSSPLMTSKQIIDYVRSLENRFGNLKHSHLNNANHKTSIIQPGNATNIDELHQTIGLLNENNQLLLRYNHEMHTEIANLIKIVHHLINNNNNNNNNNNQTRNNSTNNNNQKN